MNVVTQSWNGLHVNVLTPKNCRGYLLYVHGGPGAHSAFFEAGVRELPEFQNTGFGWICYDQRGCGRSEKETPPSHDGNISDLVDLIRYLKTTPYKLLGVMGHSYGGWLAFHTLSENPDLALPLVVVAAAKDMRTAKNHSFAIDMLELRMDHPEIYERLLPELSDFSGPLWEFQQRIRQEAPPLVRRSYFMWANLEALAWYNQIKARVAMPESWEMAHSIAAKVGTHYLLKRVDPASLSQKMLWILGVHDFLMDGDQHFPGEESAVTPFLMSGHYPHFEEPTRFVRELSAFLGPH